MQSFNISDAKTEKNKNTRKFIHIINAAIVTSVFVILLRLVAKLLSINPDLPIRSMDGGMVGLFLLSMLILLVLLFGLSLFILGYIFGKLRV